MNTLVTGATGFIGEQLCIELLKEGHKLTILGRASLEDFRKNFSLPCTYYAWKDFKHLTTPLVFDNVIHLAGASIADGRWTQKRKKIILDSRVKTLQALLDHFETHQNWPLTFISASAVGFYGDQADKSLDEESPQGQGFLSDVCGAWEKASLPFQNNSRRLLLRFGVVLSPRDGFLKQLQPLFSMGLGGKVGSGKQYMSWVHLDDVLKSILFAINNTSIHGPVNVTAPLPIQNKVFTQAYAQQLQRRSFLPAPKIALKLALGEMSALALHSQKVMPKKLEEHGYIFKFQTIEHALNNLYHWQTTANEQLYETQQWFKQSTPDLFSFFCEAKNLESITPPILGFKVLNQSTKNIAKGTLINYKLKIHGVPVRWQTLIEEWKPNEMFIDTQLKGPYKKWHHSHMFEQLAQGTLMKDRVIYEIPLGRFGRFFSGFFIRKDILSIFKFRQSKTREIFLSNH